MSVHCPTVCGFREARIDFDRSRSWPPYLASLTPEKRAVIEEARAFVHRHIPKGYAEFMNWGVINWGIPLEKFSNTHNGQPLCYVGLGAKKSYNSLYLMGTYDSSNSKYTSPFSEKLLVDAFKKAGKRLDMGKCCLHFKELEDLELTSVAKVVAMSTPNEYIAYYRREDSRSALWRLRLLPDTRPNA